MSNPIDEEGNNNNSIAAASFNISDLPFDLIDHHIFSCLYKRVDYNNQNWQDEWVKLNADKINIAMSYILIKKEITNGKFWPDKNFFQSVFFDAYTNNLTEGFKVSHGMIGGLYSNLHQHGISFIKRFPFFKHYTLAIENTFLVDDMLPFFGKLKSNVATENYKQWQILSNPELTLGMCSVFYSEVAMYTPDGNYLSLFMPQLIEKLIQSKDAKKLSFGPLLRHDKNTTDMGLISAQDFTQKIQNSFLEEISLHLWFVPNKKEIKKIMLNLGKVASIKSISFIFGGVQNIAKKLDGFTNNIEKFLMKYSKDINIKKIEISTFINQTFSEHKKITTNNLTPQKTNWITMFWNDIFK